MALNIRPDGPTVPRPDLEVVKRSLFVLPDPEGHVNLRFLPQGINVILPAGDLEALANAVEQHSLSARGVYQVINPVRAGLPEKGQAARAEDVLRRIYLFIDIDSKRPLSPEQCEQYGVKSGKDLSATDAERLQVMGVASRILDYLYEEHGWPAPIEIDSGNGHHLLYRIDLPNDQPSQLLLRRVLKVLAEKFDNEHAEVDRKCHDANRLGKLPGTWARKGPNLPDRPHRMARLAVVPENTQIVSREQLEALADEIEPTAREAAGLPPGRPPRGRLSILKPEETEVLRVRKYGQQALALEAAEVALAAEGTRNDQLNRSAFALGQLVGGGVLSEVDVSSALMYAADRAGLDRREAERTIQSGLEAGVKEPRTAPPAKDASSSSSSVSRGHLSRGSLAGQALADAVSAEDVPDIDAADVATIQDLKDAGAKIEWLWEGWIQMGVLTAFAGIGGCGKTRATADLVRRIAHGLPWPDGQPMQLPPDAKVLWVVADNHHDEMVSLADTFGIVENIRINASKSEPYGGTTLETPEDLKALAARIKAVRPALVIVDTVGNSTDKNLSRQEDAKAYYQPLQLLARQFRCAILCITHLNANGQFLGRRVLEKVRTALRISKPDPASDKRRLEVAKTNSKVPSALGVVMTDGGNEYDNDPPTAPEDQPMGAAAAGVPQGGAPGKGRGRPPARINEAMDWMREQLQNGARRMSQVLDEGTDVHGFSKDTLFKAADRLHAVKYEEDGRKWWRLPDGGTDEGPV